jgi:hypothetical protein
MPYRGESEPRIACTAHTSAEAASSCTRCHVALCDPCTLYFSAEPFCRRCVGGARRAWLARVSGGVAAVLLTLVIGTGVMLAAIPSHARLPQRAAAIISPPHPENCTPADRWLDEADRDVTFGRYHTALHHLALSQRDCPYRADRDRLYALAYDGAGDRLSAIAAASRWVDSSRGARDACALFTALLQPNGGGSLRDGRCADDTLSAQP